ncbi:Rieske 2Fe-2S domain-containing protein [Sphingobium sp. CAP-1]|uniref:Rieske 2Fe-2S domain-containing protein n=1 Tax=Sphingobium sp. CAP-1 TaxID=2676077 RepID=UPI001E389291|nr:Rieske 2Fe-2S domain-containing protein [Sphingobium sp. CAP-1]
MTPQQNDILARVEGSAPMGRLMRQHWMPACMSEEVAEPDCTPLRVRLLGENMVVFRDSKGRLGALDEQCPHRRASLAFGRNEECGLRCLYHGWKFDVNGNAIDMSSEPVDAKLRSTMKTKAYPVQEAGGFVWVWMGNPDQVTPFDKPNWATVPDDKISIVKMHGACNWAQVLEGSIDSAHSSSLHSSNMPTATEVSGSTATDTAWLRPSADKAPRLEVQKTSFGFRYVAIRKPIVDADATDYIRMTLYVAPYTVHIPSNDQYHLSQMLVPIDDENTMFYWVAWHPEKGISTDAWAQILRCRDRQGCRADHLQKDAQRRKQLSPGSRSHEGRRFHRYLRHPAQDMAMWESMGTLADRGDDRLGSSDKAIFTFRTQMYRAAQAVEKGEPAIGTTEPHIPNAKLMSFEGIVPKGTDWRLLNVSDEEADIMRTVSTDVDALGDVRA